MSSTLADRALDKTQVLPLIRKGLGLGWEHHEVLHRGSWHWHLGSATWALHQLPWGGLSMPQFPLKEGGSMQVGGFSRLGPWQGNE